MQLNYAQQLSHDTWIELADEPVPHPPQNPSLPVPSAPPHEATDLSHFRSHFVGAMELRADAATVTQYLNAHQGWFCRCAHPMQVHPIGEHGYILTIGRYGSLGFEIEPKIGLHLLPPDDQGVYRIETIPDSVPEDLGYQVDFKAALQLVDRPGETALSSSITHVEWTLDLGVALQFPRFIRRLPHSLIQVTGDRLLQQIVRQISRRLTAKVQEDFHASLTRTDLAADR
ncbi:MAG: DUF1997 domain-containing protein [Thermosynechococcaceae cyanobacterium]